MLRNHKCGHADVNIMLHMLEHFSFYCLDIAVSALHVDIVVASHFVFYTLCVAYVIFCFCCSTLLLLHIMLFFIHIVCVYRDLEVTYAHATCVHTQVYYVRIHEHIFSHLRSILFNI